MNRKAVLLFLLLFFVLMQAGYSEPVTMPEDECVKCMKNLVKYIEEEAKNNKLGNPSSVIIKDERLKKCPVSAKDYILNFDNGDIQVNCPEPIKHGCMILIYSSKSGLEREAVTFNYFKNKKIEKPAFAEKEEIFSYIKNLYDAYFEKNLGKILDFQGPAIQNAALNYEAKNKGKAEDVWMAYKTINEDLIDHQDYELFPLDFKGIDIKKVGDIYLVRGTNPIISSSKVKIIEEDKEVTFRLKISQLLLLCQGGKFYILQTDF